MCKWIDSKTLTQHSHHLALYYRSLREASECLCVSVSASLSVSCCQQINSSGSTAHSRDSDRRGERGMWGSVRRERLRLPSEQWEWEEFPPALRVCVTVFFAMRAANAFKLPSGDSGVLHCGQKLRRVFIHGEVLICWVCPHRGEAGEGR